jgi:hypothetical protein
MYIGDINFDYSGIYDYKSYSPPCKAEFRVYGSFEEIYNLKIWLEERRNYRQIDDILPEAVSKIIIDELRRDACMPIDYSKISNYQGRRFDYLGLTATNYSLIKTPMITKVIFHDPATIVYWQDKTRTVVKCKDGEPFDKEKGLAMCISKKLLGDEFHSEFRKYTEDKEVEKGGAE